MEHVAGILILLLLLGSIGAIVLVKDPFGFMCTAQYYNGSINLRNWGVSSPSQQVSVQAWLENDTVKLAVSGGGGLRPPYYYTSGTIVEYKWNWSVKYQDSGVFTVYKKTTTTEPSDSITVNGDVEYVRVEVKVSRCKQWP